MENRKRVLVLNVILTAAAVFLVWRLRADWVAAESRQIVADAGDRSRPRVLQAAAAPSNGALGSQVILRNPFSEDRSSVVVEAAAPPAGPPPQLPVVIGTMRLAGAYEALMAESAQNAAASFKQVKAGGSIGGYRVDEIRDDEVIVELDGVKTSINVYLSASGVARSSTRTTGYGEAAATPSSGPKVDSSASAPAASASAQVSSTGQPAAAEVRLPSPDPLLKITVEGNRRRYERTTMFGPQIWYEDIK